MKIPALAALATTLALSCSPANVGGDGGSTAIADACGQYAFAYCTQLETCSQTSLEQRWGIKGNCVLVQTATCEGAMNAPETASTLAWREGCTAALSAGQWVCEDFLDDQSPPPACAHPTGPRANGAPCAVSPQCESDWCAFAPGSACGTCAPPPPPGAPCSEENPCPAGVACVGTPTICTAYAGLGASCPAAGSCAARLTCVGSSPSTPGLCQAAATVPGPCDFSTDGCDFFSGYACNAVSRTCVPLRLYQPGQGCGVVEEQSSSCLSGICTRGVCVGFVPLGGACEVGGAPCFGGTYCVASTDGGTSGTCQPRGSAACP